jgi:calcium permeable stress-gated cation channel
MQGSVWAAVGVSIGLTAAIAIAFSLLRPYNSVVYAPKLKHADNKHAPPPMGKGVFAWVTPVIQTKERDLIQQVGLDATIFLRYTRMCRNMLAVITIIGCLILIPVNLSLGVQFGQDSPFLRITPLATFGYANWGVVVCAYLFNAAVAGFLWWNYRKVLLLRRQYFDSPEYQNSLHARTLMVTCIPPKLQTDEGIARLIDEIVPSSSFSRCAIARNVKDLPELIEEHGNTVRKLERYLAKYLGNPDHLPPARPLCKPSKKDPSWGSYPRGQEVDAIEYLTGRIKELETEIKEVRLSVDKRNAMSYGFASYDDIAEAHSIAFEARNKHPHGATIVLAPRPNDVIWKNLPLDKSSRRWRGIVNNIWVTILTIVWIIPNALISVFFVNLTNLGTVWDGFRDSLETNTAWWAIVQGIASPGITSLIFLLLPILFRRMSIRAGDATKTARERHVTAKLYSFFTFNNLIVFTLFSTIWSSTAQIVVLTRQGNSFADALAKTPIATWLFINICQNSPFWITFLLQRNLGAAIDLAQLWTLLWSFCVRKFTSPTPREVIELTAPPAFDYASYYNYFLFYITITMCYATIQPLVIPAAALYFAVDVYLKKYLLLYIFVTKTESGGMFWRVIFNRTIFAMILSNVVVFLVLFVHGDAQYMLAFSVVPLPLLMIGFKIYCRRVFDVKIQFYATKPVLKDVEGTPKPKSNLKSDRLSSRYGHPALYKPLITPMVHARAQNKLASIYLGRLSDSNTAESTDMVSMSGYSDTVALDPMRAGQPGRSVSAKKDSVPGFEVVPESQLDFSYYKNRSEFADEHGGGQIFGLPTDVVDRPGTASSFRGEYSTPGSSRAGSPTPVPGSPVIGSPKPGVTGRRAMTGMSRDGGTGATYPAGYTYPAAYDTRNDAGIVRPSNRRYDSDQDTRGLVGAAADMPITSPVSHRREQSLEHRAPGILGGGPRGYGGLPQEEEASAPDPTSYDYFRGRRQNKRWQGLNG